jgi:hypothetical protein
VPAVRLGHRGGGLAGVRAAVGDLVAVARAVAVAVAVAKRCRIALSMKGYNRTDVVLEPQSDQNALATCCPAVVGQTRSPVEIAPACLLGVVARPDWAVASDGWARGVEPTSGRCSTAPPGSSDTVTVPLINQSPSSAATAAPPVQQRHQVLQGRPLRVRGVLLRPQDLTLPPPSVSWTPGEAQARREESER